MRRGWVGRGLLVLLTLAGCSLEYEKDQTVAPDDVPQMVFEDLQQSGVRDGQLLYTMESQRSEVYQAKKQMRLKSFRFREYDSQGQPASSGEAEAAVIDTSSNDATISGKLTVRSDDRAVTMVVDGGGDGGLAWRNEDRILQTRPDTQVRIQKDDGSVVEARGLTLDLGSNRLELEDGVRGTWTPETEQDADPSPPPPSDSPPASQP